MSAELQVPHLSPTPSRTAEPAPRKKRKVLAFVERKLRPGSQAAASSATNDAIDDPEAEAEHGLSSPPSIVNTALGHGEGPLLRVLPPSRAGSSQSLRTRLAKYVDVSRQSDGELVLPAFDEGGSGKVLVKYEWDYVFEHQRGLRFLSTPLFSGNSLLPTDPPPFSTTGRHPVPCSLDDFQLPSPEWNWAGDGWCVDMRSDGEVQEDGFEYNWIFRRHGWRPKIGFLSAGAFVRRRRWMRLRYLFSQPNHDPHVASSVHPHVPSTSPDDFDPWHRLLHELKSTDVDRERMDIVKQWIDEAPKAREALIREHWSDTVGLFVYTYSKTVFRDMLVGMGWQGLPDGLADTFWEPGKGDTDVEAEDAEK